MKQNNQAGAELPLDTPAVEGCVVVLKLLRDIDRNPQRYEKIEVPIEVAEEQLSKPIAARNSHWKDICYPKDANEKYIQ